MCFQNKIIIILSGFIWLVSLPAIAQFVSDSLVLPEIVVEERYNSREIRSTSPFQILNNKSLQNLNALQLSDVIKHLAGLSVKDYGGIGGLKTVSVRSLGASHTTINYNGIAVSDVQTGQVDIGRFSLDNIDNVSLSIGQGDQIFAPARSFALASSLNVNSLSPLFEKAENLNGKVNLKTGSFGLFNLGFNLNKHLSNVFSYQINGEWMRADGRYPYTLHYGTTKHDSTSLEKRENSDVENYRIESALFAKFSDKTKGNLRLYYFQSERGLPGATIFYNTKKFSRQRLWDHTFFAQGNVEHQFSQKWFVQANAKYNNGYLLYLDPTYLGSESKIEDIFDQSEMYGSVALLFRTFDNLSFSGALDITHNAMTSNRINFATPNRLTAQSAIASKWVSNRMMATASLLYTQTTEGVKNGKAAQNRKKFSPHVSISVKPLSSLDFRIRAFYKNSFRLPTFNDLYYPSVGSQSLLPENANQFNLGTTFNFPSTTYLNFMQLTIDVYANKVTNKIVAYPTSNLHQWAMINVGQVDIKGIDIAFENAIRLNKKSNLTWAATYTFQNAKDISDSDGSTYLHQIAYTPFHFGSARAVWQYSSFDVSYSMLWSGFRYSSGYNAPENKMRGYVDHSLAVAKDFVENNYKFRVGIEALNLANNNYQIVRNYPMPGRSYRLNFTLNF